MCSVSVQYSNRRMYPQDCLTAQSISPLCVENNTVFNHASLSRCTILPSAHRRPVDMAPGKVVPAYDAPEYTYESDLPLIFSWANLVFWANPGRPLTALS